MYDYDVILSFITAFALTYFAIPSIISVAKKKNLLVKPNGRSSHKISTPSLGGIAIFAGTVFSIVMWTSFSESQYAGNLQYILCSFIIIFLIGAKDDIDPMSPTKKLVGEILAAVILVFKADIRLTGLHGVFGLGAPLPYWISVLLTIFIVIVIINAFNLIDGINGLSGSIATLISGGLGTWFLFVKQYDLAIVAFSLTGAVVAFLKYNFSPASIFMGDTGSLLIGLICSILSIRFIEVASNMEMESPFKINAAPAVAVAFLIFPLFDTMRVFLTRTFKGKSPLSPDRKHIHHLLIDSGLNHTQATLILVIVNAFFIVLALSLQQTYTKQPSFLIILLVAIASLLVGGFYYSVYRRRIKHRPA